MARQQAKRTKEEKETEYIQAMEMLLGFPLPEWMKPKMLEIRRASLAGEVIDFSTLKKP